jgi:hypothetical protein
MLYGEEAFPRRRYAHVEYGSQTLARFPFLIWRDLPEADFLGVWWTEGDFATATNLLRVKVSSGNLVPASEIVN